MDIKDYFNILWRRKWVFVLTVIGALVVVFVGNSVITPVYQATATLRVAASAGGPLNYTASTYSNQLLNTTAQIASSRPILELLVDQLGLSDEPVISAAVVPQTELIKITVEYSNAEKAAQTANTLADFLIAQSNELYTGGNLDSLKLLEKQVSQYKSDLDKTRQDYEALLVITPPAPEKAAMTLEILQLKERNYETLLLQYNEAILQQEVRANMMTVVERAIVPASPIRPNRLFNYVVGFALGMLGGVVLAFINESFDSTLYSDKEIESLVTLPVLAKIPRSTHKEILMAPNDVSPLAESFRNLALGILLAMQDQGGKVLLVTSAEPRQGKSTATANLAISLAEYGKRVVAVDCDMRMPSLHDRFDLSNQRGLMNILEGDSALENELRSPIKGLGILTSGPHPANPSQLLSSPRMAEVLHELKNNYDFVLLDTPALLSVSDASAIVHNYELVKNIDMFLLVVRQGFARRDNVKAAVRFLQRFPGKTAGLVINQTPVAESYSYYKGRRGAPKRAVAGK